MEGNNATGGGSQCKKRETRQHKYIDCRNHGKGIQQEKIGGKMPYKEGKKWRGVISKGKKRIAQKTFLTKRAAVEWERVQRNFFTTDSIGMDLLAFSTFYLANSKLRHSKKTFEEKRRLMKVLTKLPLL